MKAEDVQLLATHAAEAVNRLSAADPKGAAVIMAYLAEIKRQRDVSLGLVNQFRKEISPAVIDARAVLAEAKTHLREALAIAQRNEAGPALDAARRFMEKRAILADLITRFICPHPDDLAVDRFAAAMKAKLAAKRAEGYGGWDDPTLCRVEFLSRKLREHVEKGDPVDVANFAMMLHQRGSAILPPNEVTEAAIAEHYREACAALVDEMLERKSWSDQPWAKCALIIAARAIRRGRHLTAREMLDNMMRPIAEAEEDAEDEYLCTACGESIREGDYVYIENDEGGFVHAECCGPERESYCDMDGNPLKPGDPIPEPFQFKL